MGKSKKKKKKDFLTTILLIVILVVGLGIMLYPTVSNWWNQQLQNRAIANYYEDVNNLSETDYEDILNTAYDYNSRLSGLSFPLLEYDYITGYDEALNISGNGIMGYIDIPQINVHLPIYHGTEDKVLNKGVGHLEGTSLPVGGESTHAVLSAHRGLPSAKLFSDLDKIVVGDEFTITILNEVYTYEVEEIFTVLPDQSEYLEVIPGKEYVTLMTCTPYGINTHRLLVRAHRIDTVEEHIVKVTSDGTQVDPMLVIPIVMVPLLLIMFIAWSVSGRRKRKKAKVNRLVDDTLDRDDHREDE